MASHVLQGLSFNSRQWSQPHTWVSSSVLLLTRPKHAGNYKDMTVLTTFHVLCGWGLGPRCSCQANLGLVLFSSCVFHCGLESKSCPQVSLQWKKNGNIFNWHFWKEAESYSIWRRTQGTQCFSTTKNCNFLGFLFPFSLPILLWWPEINFQPSHGMLLQSWLSHSHPPFPYLHNGDCFPMGGSGGQIPPLQSPRRLPARSVTLSAGKGGHNSPAHLCKVFWDPRLINAIPKGWGIWGARRKGEGEVYDVFINSSPIKKPPGGEGNQTEISSHADEITGITFVKIIEGLEHQLPWGWSQASFFFKHNS